MLIGGTHPEGDVLLALVLGELAEDQQLAVELHLDTCRECEEVVAELQTALGALAVTAPPTPPPPALREVVMAAIHADAAEPPAPREPEAAAPRRSVRRWLAWPRVAVPALAIVAGIAVLTFTIHTQESSTRTVALSSGAGTVHVHGSNASLDASSLAPAPTGRTYEAWVIHDSKAQAAGLFEGGDADVPLAREVAPGDVVAVTVEPPGGSPQPTSAPIAEATL